MFEREYRRNRYQVLWEHTLPQINRFLDARKRYVEEMNKQNSQTPQSESESILKEAEARGPLTMDEVREMMKEL